ncbi:MAG: hypothetical protein H7837_14100 [Magnetococcus sp. MYC-9]
MNEQRALSDDSVVQSFHHNERAQCMLRTMIKMMELWVEQTEELLLADEQLESTHPMRLEQSSVEDVVGFLYAILHEIQSSRHALVLGPTT